LIKSGRVVSRGFPFNSDSPQGGGFGGRTNPVHSMLQPGGDIAVGAQDHPQFLRNTDDAVSMPLRCGTQWDALAHIFCRSQMYNSHGLHCLTTAGASFHPIDRIADEVVGRGVLLDIPRYRGVDWLRAGEAILTMPNWQTVWRRSGRRTLGPHRLGTNQTDRTRACQRLLGRVRLRSAAGLGLPRQGERTR
jgi:hypothetical protein